MSSMPNRHQKTKLLKIWTLVQEFAGYNLLILKEITYNIIALTNTFEKKNNHYWNLDIPLH